jgi:hypothetical protein
MTRIIPGIAAALALAAMLPVMLPVTPANAQGAIRSFVAVSNGSDSNPCTITAPCRHFSAALAATAVGGEIDALEPGAYGSFTINQAVTIDGQSWSYVAPPNGGAAITINAVSGNVIIRGVSANGVGATGGTNGILFNSGSSLTIADCTLQNFVNSEGSGGTNGNGILMQPTSGTLSFAITNTTVSNNGFGGIRYIPTGGSTTTANGVIDHVVVTNNGPGAPGPGIGLNILGGGGSTNVVISNSILNGNNAGGIYAFGGPAAALTVSINNTTVTSNGTGINIQGGAGPETVSIDNITAAGNVFGISATGPSTVLLGRSVITANTNYGVGNSSTAFSSYGDNRINGNGTGPGSDVEGTALTPFLPTK